MAQYPCDRHGGRYRGPQATFYLSVYQGDFRLKKRYRLCGTCVDVVREVCASFLLDLEDAAAANELRCPECGREADAGYITATLYEGDEPIKLFGNCCADHAELMPKAFQMTPGSGTDRD